MYRLRMIVVILVVALLAGCSVGGQASQPAQTDPPLDLPYEIIIENGEHYLLLKDSIAGDDESDKTSASTGTFVEFESIEEMAQDIKTGNFTESELKQISKFRKDEDGRTVLCDLSKLHEAYTPEQFANQEILWFGNNYRFDFSQNEDYFECRMIAGFPNDSKDFAIADITDCTDKPNFTLLSTEQISDRNATMITYTSGVNGKIKERKSIYYELENGDKELFVYEEYSLLSDKVPYMIVVFGTEKEFDYSLYIYFPPERPSVEYLLGFGFREYVETEVA